jgi:hypothetical protein
MNNAMTIEISSDFGTITNVSLRGIPADYNLNDVIDAVEYYADRGVIPFIQALPYVKRGCMGKPYPGCWVFLDNA